MIIDTNTMGIDWKGQPRTPSINYGAIIDRAREIWNTQNLNKDKVITTSTIFNEPPTGTPRVVYATPPAKSPEQILLETSWQWKAFPGRYFATVQSEFLKKPYSHRTGWINEIQRRVRSWTPNFIEYVKKFNVDQIRRAGFLFPSIKPLIPKLLIEKDLPYYLETVTESVKGMDGQEKEDFIFKVKNHLDRYAPKNFMSDIPERIGSPFADEFLKEEINKNIDAAAFGLDTGGAGKIFGLAVVGIIGLTLISNIGGKRKRK